MKSILLVFLILIVVSSVFCAKRDPVRDRTRRRAAIRCVRETKIKYSTVRKLEKGDFTDDSEKSKCFLKCYGSKVGMFKTEDKDGMNYEVDKEYLIKYMDDIITDHKKIPEIVNLCASAENGTNICDFAFNAYKCYFDEVGKVPGLVELAPSLIGSEKEVDEALNSLKIGFIDADEDWFETFEETNEAKIPQ